MERGGAGVLIGGWGVERRFRKALINDGGDERAGVLISSVVVVVRGGGRDYESTKAFTSGEGGGGIINIPKHTRYLVLFSW